MGNRINMISSIANDSSSNGTSSPCKSKVEALEGEDMGS